MIQYSTCTSILAQGGGEVLFNDVENGWWAVRQSLYDALLHTRLYNSDTDIL